MTDNPLWVREVRARMRGGKAYAVLLAYTLLLTLLSAVVYLQWFESHESSGSRFTGQAAFQAGQILFRTLFVTQAILITLITPAVTSGAITLEREQRTLEMMAMTRLRPREIIWGKLGAAVAFVALLLTSSLPLVSLSFLLGGVSPGELFFTYLSLLVTALLFGAAGLLCSSLVPSTAAATALSYGAVGLFFFVSLIPVSYNPGAPILPFRSVNAVGAVFYATSAETFFRTSLPSWLIAVTMCGLLALLLANVAMTRLEHFDEPRPFPIRLLGTALWALFFLVQVGYVLGSQAASLGAGGARREVVTVLAGTGLALLLLLLPVFATGDVFRLTPRTYLAGMLPHRLFAGDLPSGVPVLLLWLTIPLLWIALGFAVISRTGGLTLYFDTLLPLAIVSFAFVAFCTAVGHFLSVWLPSRWSAMATTYVLILGLTLLPYLTLIGWRDPFDAAPTRPRPIWQALYLSPFMSFVERGSDAAFWGTIPPMWAGQTPFWLVTTALYSLLTTLFGLATLSALRRQAKQTS